MAKSLVIVPVYNEESTIRDVLGELCRYYSGDVVIVDDGSTDCSIPRIHECIKKRPVTLITHTTNLGYGRSLIDGFGAALRGGYDIAVTMDCDWQHQPRQVPSFIESLGSADVLSGSRYLHNFAENTGAPADRRSINETLTAEINRITGFSLTDSFCGFKAYRCSALKQLTLDEAGYAFPIQFWVQAYKAGLAVREFAVPRIYTGAVRSFGELNDAEVRLAHYRAVLQREVARWNITLTHS